jgi:hypothetical protein
MSHRTPIVNWAGDYEETCLQLGKHLGTNKIRRKLFNAIYGRTSRPRSKKQMILATGLKASDSQQAQNELDYLWRYGLIARNKNDGSVKDGSRYLYQKDDNVRAHRDRIIRHADNPRDAKKVPTKRRPVFNGTNVIIRRQALKKRKRLDVLYLTANPDKNSSLRVDVEVRQVQAAVRGSKLRDNIELHYRPAADLDSIIEGLNDHSPKIVHFSGHGYAGGIALDHPKVERVSGRVITFNLLAKALGGVDAPPDVIVLNACESAGARKAFFPPAKAIIVMRNSVSDLAATAFSAKFYAAIAAGQSLKSAFTQGQVAIAAVSIDEAATPELMVAVGVNPAKLVLT